MLRRPAPARTGPMRRRWSQSPALLARMPPAAFTLSRIPPAVIDNPWFYVLAIPALLITGISKGGFGAGLGTLAVPLMALAVSPAQAAAVMLPILCVMDGFGLWMYRARWDRRNMAIILPGAALGIGIGGLTFQLMDDDVIRLVIGLIAVLFALDRWLRRGGATRKTEASVRGGGFWGAVAGFTSTVAHAGGPPINLYLLPQRMDKTLFVGTTVIFFALVNLLKLPVYAAIGQFTLGNLGSAAVLLPLAPLGMWLGFWLHRRVDGTLFYRLCYTALFFVGLKLVWDGVSGLA